jgi:hypothetical protein
MQDLFSDLELDFTLKDHYDFIDGMSVIFPCLAGRICPDIATKATGPPVGSDRIDVDQTGGPSVCKPR